MLVVHPGTGSRCQAAEAQEAAGWSRAAVCIHGDLVICGECGELGVIPRPGLGHMMELLPGATVQEAKAAMTQAVQAPPAEVVQSPQGEDRSGFQRGGATWHGNAFGFCKATESTNFTDSTFAANWEELQDEGLPRGAYHYFHPNISPIDQAHFFVRTVMPHGLHRNDCLIVDAEITTGADGTTLEYSSAHAASRSHLVGAALGSVSHPGVVGSGAKLFLDTVVSLTGHEIQLVLTYTDLAVAAFLGPVATAGYPLWIAYPGSRFPASVFPWPKTNTRFWQWEFGGGLGGGDRDAFMGDHAEFEKYFSAAPPPPPPVHTSLTSMTGDDEMTFYLPNGAGATVSLLPPAAVPQADGTLKPPVELRLTSNGPTSMEYDFGGADGGWTPFPTTVEFIGSPHKLALDGHPAVKIRRTDAGTNPVTATWA